ncbi:MAG: phosphoribosylformylglycinamidine cyclo-ligase [candidate division WOR-3 bacterium]
MRYKEAGVDIDYADFIKKRIKKFIPEISKGRFAGIYKINKDNYLAATVDGVGTKLILAKEIGYLEGIGIDIVNHCVNDLLCVGARPLFFLDYIASSNLKEIEIYEIIKGIDKALKEHDAFLIGGETAEMPDIYNKSMFDLVGCMIGILKKENIIPKKLKEGDLIYGISSSGLHTNGFSLVRKIIKDKNISLETKIGNKKLKNLLLIPHRSYFKILYPLIIKNRIKACVHITGGGFEGNIKRVLDEGLSAEIDFKDFEVPEIFKFIQEMGEVPEEEMFKVFNMGIGMIIIFSKKDEDYIKKYFKKLNEPIYFLGVIKKFYGKKVKIYYRR